MEKVKQLCERWRVAELAAFGSVLTPRFTPQSDVDFLVRFAKNAKWDYFDFFDLKNDLAELTGREVDLLPIQSFLALQKQTGKEIERELIYEG